MPCGIIFVLSAPSGTGKTSLCQALCTQDPHLVHSISATTRPQRPNEHNEVDYIFLTENVFLQWIDQDKFIEWNKIYGHYYGTLRQSLEQTLAAGKHMLFTVDWQGMQQLKAAKGDQVVTIFVLPPSGAVLKDRLVKRGQDTPQAINNRIKAAQSEMGHWTEYTYTVINENFSETVKNIQAIITAEQLRQCRQFHLTSFIESLHL